MQQISTHFDRLMVEVLPCASGIGTYDVSDFVPGETYRVLATYLKKWEDGSTTLMFLMGGPDGTIVEKACSRFKIAEVT